MQPSTRREGCGRAARRTAGRGPRQTAMRLARIGIALGALTIAGACSVSARDEREIGRDEAASIDSQVPIVQDTAITQFAARLGQSLTSQSGRTDVEWRFSVVNVWPVNAFALPGGYVYVTRGLIEQADRLDELAGVMGHEVAHVVRRHTANRSRRGASRTRVSSCCAP